MSFRLRRRRRAPSRHDSSCRRLSLVVNPDLINDVAVYEIDQWSRPAPSRRHSIAAVVPPPTSDGEQINLTSSLPVQNKRSKSVSTLLLDSFHDQKLVELRQPLQRQEFLELEEDVGQEAVPPTNSFAAALLFGGVVFGSVLASGSLQRLNNLQPGCGQLITLLQYLATIGEKSPKAQKYISSPVLPMQWHAVFVLLMFLSVRMGNASLEEQYGLPFGLFLVIKNTNLVFSLALGLIMGRRYTFVQVMSVATVTAGILLCVLAQDNDKESNLDVDEKVFSAGSAFIVGAALCAASTFCMATLGCVQEYALATYKDKDGQSAGESIFFTHLLGLPLFATGGGIEAMKEHVYVLSKTPGTTAVLLVLNVCAAVVLKQCFVELLEEGGALTATMAVTVSRMVGVVLSALVVSGSVEASPGAQFWFGAATVTAGSFAYAIGGKIGKRKPTSP